MLHIKVRLPVLLCAVKTVEGDFRFCWTTTPNVGQTHKENPNLVRILYMVCTLNDIYKQYNKLHKNQFTSLCRGQKPASKCIRLVYEILVRCRALQALYTPQRCELVKTKTNNTNCSYRIFIVCRSPVSPVFWARVSLSNNSLPEQSSCTQISLDITSIGINGTPLVPDIGCPEHLEYTTFGSPTVYVLARLC